MALRPAPTKRSSRSKEVFSSAVQPKTLPPRTSGAMERSVRPRRRFCKTDLRDDWDRADAARWLGSEPNLGLAASTSKAWPPFPRSQASQSRYPLRHVLQPVIANLERFQML